MTDAHSPLQASPIPSAHSLLGHIKPFMEDILGFLMESRKSGSFVHFKLMRKKVYLLSDPELVNQVLTNKSQAFVRNRSFAKRLRRLFGHGLLTSEGEQWKQLRKLSAPAFQPNSTNSYIPIILSETQRLLEEWNRKPNVSIDHEMSKVTARIITRCIFGMELDVNIEEMESAMDELMASLGPRIRFPINTPDWLPVGGNRTYRRAVNRVNRFIQTSIQQRFSGKEEQQNCLLADLKHAAELDGKLTPDLLRDQVVTLFLAGHETTANTLTFAFILLSQYPQYWSELQKEVANVDFNQCTNLNQVKTTLPFTHNVIRETMRLYPAGYVFGRTTAKQTQLGNETLSEGNLVLISPYVIHRDETVFPNPEQFQPHRWQQLSLSRTQFLPFSAGARTCIGEYLAMLETCLILAKVASEFQVQCGTAPLKIQPAITLRPLNNTQAILNPLTH